MVSVMRYSPFISLEEHLCFASPPHVFSDELGAVCTHILCINTLPTWHTLNRIYLQKSK